MRKIRITKKTPAALTAALLSFACVAASASAAGAVDVEYDEDGIDIGGGVLAFINEKDESKFEDYTLEASSETLTGTTDDDGNTVVDTANDPVIKDLSKSLKKEFGKIKVSDVAVYKIDLAKGIYSEDKSPAAIKITIPSVSFDAKVYHVSGDGVKLLKANSRQLAAGGYEVSFTTTGFSSFILTNTELKNAGAASDASEPSSSDASSDVSGAVGSNNANTGIALAIAPVVLAAGAVAVVALKKKED